MAKLNLNPQHVIAHEMGHALGLVHSDEPGNLMEPSGDSSCVHWFSQAQIEALTTGGLVISSPDEAFSSLLDARRTVLDKVLGARRRPSPAATSE